MLCLVFPSSVYCGLNHRVIVAHIVYKGLKNEIVAPIDVLVSYTTSLW